MELELETKEQDGSSGGIAPGIVMTPAIDEDYWSYRVSLTEEQAVVGFPKMGTIGIGFMVEDDWNTNLPYTVSAEDILAHISHNKGDESIDDQDVLEAIRIIQAAVVEERGGTIQGREERREKFLADRKERS